MLATISSAFTKVPDFTLHFANTPCVIDSPMVGTGTVTFVPTLTGAAGSEGVEGGDGLAAVGDAVVLLVSSTYKSLPTAI